MKLNNLTKISFDIIMFILLVIAYLAQPTRIPAHEYLGIAIYVFFIIHLVYNFKLITSVIKRFFDKTLNAEIKFIYIIDLLLFISFILIGISGVMISRVIFSIGIIPVWRQLHTIVSGISIILLAVHIGLHGSMIINTVKTEIKIPYIVIKTSAIVILITILFGGLYGEMKNRTSESQRQRYSTVTYLFDRSVSFTRMMINPPQEPMQRQGQQKQMQGRGQGQQRQMQEQQIQGQGQRQMQEQGQRPQRGDGQRTMPSFNINRLIISTSNYLAHILVYSIIVYCIVIIAKKIKKKFFNY